MPSTSQPGKSPRRWAEEASTDEAVLAGVARGEPGAERAFVRRFQRSVYGLATAIVGDPRHAEDIAEEALSLACRQARTHDPYEGSVSTWVLRITRNLAVDALRRQRLEPADPPIALSLGEFGGEGPSDRPADRVRAALRQIPMDERRTLILSTFHGYSARDISEADGISVGEARHRMRAGLTRMRQLLERDEPARPRVKRSACEVARSLWGGEADRGGPPPHPAGSPSR